MSNDEQTECVLQAAVMTPGLLWRHHHTLFNGPNELQHQVWQLLTHKGTYPHVLPRLPAWFAYVDTYMQINEGIGFLDGFSFRIGAKAGDRLPNLCRVVLFSEHKQRSLKSAWNQTHTARLVCFHGFHACSSGPGFGLTGPNRSGVKASYQGVSDAGQLCHSFFPSQCNSNRFGNISRNPVFALADIYILQDGTINLDKG